jgi:hypothetical protein
MVRQGSHMQDVTAARHADPDKTLVGSLQWRDPSSGLATATRMVVAADGQQVVAVMGECVLAADAPVEIANVCKAALQTLDPEIAPAARVALALVDDVKPGAGSGAGPADTGSGAGSAVAEPPPPAPKPPLLDDGTKVAYPATSVQQEAPSDPRPLYIGGGLVLMAAVFWWNRRRRERFEKEAEDGDADAGDLHAAAEQAKNEDKPA